MDDHYCGKERNNYESPLLLFFVISIVIHNFFSCCLSKRELGYLNNYSSMICENKTKGIKSSFLR